MSLNIKPIEVQNKSELVSLASAQLKEQDLQVLDQQVGTQESGYADLIAVNPEGHLFLVFLLQAPREASLLIKAITTYHWACENILNLKKMYPQTTIDASKAPGLIFLTHTFSRQIKRALQSLSIRVQALEYRAFEVNQVPCLSLERIELKENEDAFWDVKKEELKKEYSSGSQSLSEDELEAVINFEKENN